MIDTVNTLFIDDCETAIRLKKLGFDDPCSARFFGRKMQRNTLGHWYKHNSGEIDKRYVSCPTLEQVENWMERVHEIFICVEHGGKTSGKYRHDYVVWGKFTTSKRGFFSRREARVEAIMAAIRCLEKK